MSDEHKGFVIEDGKRLNTDPDKHARQECLESSSFADNDLDGCKLCDEEHRKMESEVDAESEKNPIDVIHDVLVDGESSDNERIRKLQGAREWSSLWQREFAIALGITRTVNSPDEDCAAARTRILELCDAMEQHQAKSHLELKGRIAVMDAARAETRKLLLDTACPCEHPAPQMFVFWIETGKMEILQCPRCLALLPLGESDEEPVAVEVRAAEIAAGGMPLHGGMLRAMSWGEGAGYDRDGDIEDDPPSRANEVGQDGFGVEVDKDEWFAGWLAREIVDHGKEGT